MYIRQIFGINISAGVAYSYYTIDDIHVFQVYLDLLKLYWEDFVNVLFPEHSFKIILNNEFHNVECIHFIPDNVFMKARALHSSHALLAGYALFFFQYFITYNTQKIIHINSLRRNKYPGYEYSM